MVAKNDVRLAPEPELVSTTRHACAGWCISCRPRSSRPSGRWWAGHQQHPPRRAFARGPDFAYGAGLARSGARERVRPGPRLRDAFGPYPRSDLRGGWACPSSRRSRIAGELSETATSAYGSRSTETGRLTYEGAQYRANPNLSGMQRISPSITPTAATARTRERGELRFTCKA